MCGQIDKKCIVEFDYNIFFPCAFSDILYYRKRHKFFLYDVSGADFCCVQTQNLPFKNRVHLSKNYSKRQIYLSFTINLSFLFIFCYILFILFISVSNNLSDCLQTFGDCREGHITCPLGV